MKNLTNSENLPEPALLTGAIDYPLMNDYMFRSVMQSSEKVLKGLLCALLRLNPEDVRTVQVLNPIELGYLSRLFDGLNVGESYRAVKPACQIGILNFTLFPKYPEFFSTYKMLNTKNYQKYSDKFTIHVLDLTQVHLAEKDDKDHELDRWARMFTASTWEEFKMISADNKYMEEAGKTLFTLNGDDRIREQCEAREDYRRTWEGVKQEMEELKALNEKNNTVIEELKASSEKKDALIASLKTQITRPQKL